MFDFVHVLHEGKIVKTGDKNLLNEEKGYDWLKLDSKVDMLIDNNALIQKSIKGLNVDPIFRESSKSALAKINTLPFPNRRQERWKYVKLSNFKKTNFHNDSKFALKTLKELNIPLGSENLIVIENGKLNKKLSNLPLFEGLEIIPFSKLESDSLTFLNQYNEDYNHYFSYLNQYLLNDGILIKVSRNIKISDSLKIVNLATSNDIFINSRLNISLDEGAKLNLTQFYASTNQISNGVINQICEYDLKKSASLEVDKFQLLNNNNNVCSDFVKQEEKSCFKMNTSFQVVCSERCMCQCRRG